MNASDRRILASRTRIVMALEGAFAMDPSLRKNRFLSRVWTLIEEDRLLRRLLEGERHDLDGTRPTA